MVWLPTIGVVAVNARFMQTGDADGGGVVLISFIHGGMRKQLSRSPAETQFRVRYPLIKQTGI